MPLVPDFFVDDVDLVDDVDNHLSKDVGEAVRTVNGCAVMRRAIQDGCAVGCSLVIAINRLFSFYLESSTH
jgi:hypothetical protein